MGTQGTGSGDKQWENGAALYVKDIDAPDTLLDKAIETVANTEQLAELSKNIATLAYTDSAEVIADEVYKLAKTYQETMHKA